MKFKIILSQRGKEIFKGGNIEVLTPLLNQVIDVDKYKVKAQAEHVAENILYYRIIQSLGSGSFNLYALEELKGGNK